MNILTEIELDALTEVFNVGAGRAAQSLSEIVGDGVRLSVPSIEILKSNEVNAKVLALSHSRFATVSQFSPVRSTPKRCCCLPKIMRSKSCAI